MATTGEFHSYPYLTSTYGPTYSGTGTSVVVGGGGISGGGGYGGGVNTTDFQYLISPSLPPFPTLLPREVFKPSLTEMQLHQLLNEHTFIPMDGNAFCLLCYALDQYRMESEHIFVIHEE